MATSSNPRQGAALLPAALTRCLLNMCVGLALVAGKAGAMAQDSRQPASEAPPNNTNAATPLAAQAAPAVVTRLVSFSAMPSGMPVMGVYRRPARGAVKAAVVILHGSAGIDSRGPLHALDLARSGIATLEIDMWGARGLAGGTQRPARVHDTLGDLWGALAWLGQQPQLDARRLGVMGFSWGGVMAMLASTQAHGTPPTGVPVPAAQLAFYPVCWGYNRVPGYDFQTLRDTRLLILAGGLDGYDDDPGACPNLVAGLAETERAKIKVHVYPEALHGFNMLEPALRYPDAFAHRGRGGETGSVPDPAAREDARQRVTAFFATHLAAD